MILLVLKYQLLGMAKETHVLVDPAFWLLKGVVHMSQILRQQYHILDGKLTSRILKFFSDLKHTT